MTNLNDLEATAQDLLAEANHLYELAEDAKTDDEWFALLEDADAKVDAANAILDRIH